MFDVHMCFFGILCADPSVRWLSAYTQGTLPVSLGVITLIKSGFHWASCLMLQVSGSLLNLLFCFCIATLYNICMLKSIYCLHFPFPFPFFLKGGRVRETTWTWAISTKLRGMLKGQVSRIRRAMHIYLTHSDRKLPMKSNTV